MEPHQPITLTPAPVWPQAPAIPAGGTPKSHPALSAPPDPQALLKALRRRWALALGLGLCLAAVAGPATWYLLPRSKYTASATLRVSPHPRRIMFEPKDGATDPATYQRTVVALLRDPAILSHALDDPKIAGLHTVRELTRDGGDVEEWISKNLAASFREGSEMLVVTLSGDQPDDLAAIVNAVIDSYKTLVLDEEREERVRRLEKLQTLWERYQGELKAKRKSLAETAASVDSHDELSFVVAQQFKTAQLNLAQGELMRAQGEAIRARAELSALEETRGGETAPAQEALRSGPAPAVADSIERHPDVVRLRGQVDDLARKYWEVRRVVRQQHDPALAAVQGKWAAAKRQLDQLRARLPGDESAPAPGDQVVMPPSGQARESARLRAQLQVLDGYQKSLADNITRLQKALKDSNRGGLDLENERQEITIATDFAQKVGAEIEYVKVESDAQDRVIVFSRAKPPKVKDESRRLKVGGMAALGSFALCLLGVSFLEFRARRVDTIDEVVNILGLRLVGSLPALPARSARLPGKASPPQDSAWQGVLLESVNATRTMLLHASRVESVRAVMISSAVSGEGKTSLACHLATSLARAGRKTLLIEGDLRCPAVHRLFNGEPEPGLCELLRKESGLGDVIQQTPIADLDMVAAGRFDPLAMQALARNELQPLLSRLKKEYDFIIVDSAPLLHVADSLLIGQSVDAVLFSVLRDVSRLPAVNAACERLSLLGVKILGAVVSGVRGTAYGSPKYYAKS